MTADGGFRRGQTVPLKQNIDQAIAGNKTISRVIVLRRTGLDIHIEQNRDVWWHREAEYVSSNCEPVAVDSEHPLFILYTSGSTGKPKGILHTTGGFLVGTSTTTRYVFDLREEDIYWCTADVGWVTGHSYVVYGPLTCGATCFMYEGAPKPDDADCFWRLIAKYGVTILYTAPTAIRAFMKWGDQWPAKHDLTSLRLLGTVGEPINPEAWMWFFKNIGGSRCPIVDTWWQTETGMHMITPLPGATPLKPGTATLPFFGVDAAIVDDNGKEVGPNEGGKLVIRKPWPAMLRSIYGDKTRYKNSTGARSRGATSPATARAATRTATFGLSAASTTCSTFRVTASEPPRSRVPSSRTRLLAEAAVVGRPDEIKGQGVVAFVTLRTGTKADKDLAEKLRKHVGQVIGPIAKPDDIRFTEGLPKTRSGKIMRRLLKQVASGVAVTGDTTTLEDFSVLAKLSKSDE